MKVVQRTRVEDAGSVIVVDGTGLCGRLFAAHAVEVDTADVGEQVFEFHRHKRALSSTSTVRVRWRVVVRDRLAHPWVSPPPTNSGRSRSRQ